MSVVQRSYVVIKGTTTGVKTDLDGNYRISVEDGATLIFSYVGFDPQEIEVGTGTTIDLVMEGATELQEVIIVGYGEQSRRLSTQSVASITNDAIANLPVLSAQEALQGQAAGVQMVGASGIIRSRPTVRIRGGASLGGAEPLYIVDGVPLINNDNSLNAGGVEMNPLATINPAEIESISVLKDASAVAIYGSRGSNGVIIINTKKGKRNQETKISLDSYPGWVSPTVKRQMMNADQYREYTTKKLIGQKDNLNAKVSDLPQDSFDWPSGVLKTGKTDNYSINARGGSESTSFFVRGTYFKQDGYTIGNSGDRLSFRLNMDQDRCTVLSYELQFVSKP